MALYDRTERAHCWHVLVAQRASAAIQTSRPSIWPKSWENMAGIAVALMTTATATVEKEGAQRVHWALQTAPETLAVGHTPLMNVRLSAKQRGGGEERLTWTSWAGREHLQSLSSARCLWGARQEAVTHPALPHPLQLKRPRHHGTAGA